MLSIFKDPKHQGPLPKNRFEQFFDIVQFNYRSLMLLSFLTFLFFIPLIIWMYISTITDSALYAEILSYGDDVPLELYNELKTQTLINAIIYVPLISITFIGLSGMIGTFRKFFYRDIVELPANYFECVKKNWLSSLLIGLFYSMAISSITFSNLFFNESVIWNIIGIVLIVFVSIFFLFVLSLNVYYTESIGSLLFNSFILLIVRLPQNLLSIVVLVLPVLFVVFLPKILGITLMIIVYTIIWLAFGILAFEANAIGAFDKYINQKSFPDIYKKGLVKKDGKENSEHSL